MLIKINNFIFNDSYAIKSRKHSFYNRYFRSVVTTKALSKEIVNTAGVNLVINYFRQVPWNQLHNDALFLEYHYSLQEKNIIGFSYPVHLALQQAYRKRYFKIEDLKNIISSSIDIQNRLSSLTVSEVDIATVISGYQADMLVKKTTFDKATVIVNTNPVGTLKPYLLSKELQDRIHLSKLRTGNTYNDVDIEEHQYDFKYTDQLKRSKNHIYFFSQENFEKNIRNHLHDLLIILERESQLYKGSQYGNYLYICKEFLVNARNKYTNVGDTNDNWNTFLQKTMDIRPLEFTSPILVKSSNRVIEHSDVVDVERLPQIEAGHLTDVKVIALMHKLLALEPLSVQNKAFIATNGVLGSPKSESWDDVD
jgi:hypothetical protein